MEIDENKEEEEEELNVVDCILFVDEQSKEALIKWENSDITESTWEPLEDAKSYEEGRLLKDYYNAKKCYPEEFKWEDGDPFIPEYYYNVVDDIGKKTGDQIVKWKGILIITYERLLLLNVPCRGTLEKSTFIDNVMPGKLSIKLNTTELIRKYPKRKYSIINRVWIYI